MFRTFNRCVFVISTFVWPEGGGHNVFNAAQLPSSWLKIPKSVIGTDSPVSSFKYLMYLAEMCCDSESCSCFVDVPVKILSLCCGCGVVGTFSLPCIHHSPCGFPYNLCALRQQHHDESGTFLVVMAGG